MKICYPVITPESSLTNVKAMCGDFEQNLKILEAIGFDGVELMVRNPGS
jgi:hypothetical protein